MKQKKARSSIVLIAFSSSQCYPTVKQDFACSRDVLVREMEYFAEYLTPDSLAEMDISVHCDIAIFDWLMRYTKRGLKEGPGGETLPEPQEAPQLDVTNISSILISSDFLKMEALVSHPPPPPPSQKAPKKQEKHLYKFITLQ